MNEQCGHWMVLDESEIGSDAQDQQATEAVDESKLFFFGEIFDLIERF